MLYSKKKLFSYLEKLRSTKESVTMSQICRREFDGLNNKMVIRCDIERNLSHCRNFARKLNEIGIKSSFYFHTRKNCYDPFIFEYLSSLGHEIGYHHECLDRTRGDFEAAKELFLLEINQFRRDGFPVTTVCSHGESELPKNGYKFNYELFVKFPNLLDEANVMGEVFTSIFKHDEILKVSDVYSQYLYFYRKIQKSIYDKKFLQIVIHPHRWHNFVLRTIFEINKDLLQRYKNRITKIRTYKTILD